MKATFFLILAAFTITNGIFVFLLHADMKMHESVINRHGTIISIMLETPQIKDLLQQEIDRRQSTQSQ